MSPQRLTELTLRDAPALRHDEPLGAAVQKVLDRNLPALPVVDDEGRYLGIFGEREFLQALFPGYVGQLHGAGFLKHAIDDVLERRTGCRDEPVAKHINSERIAVGREVSDVQVAEIFLHHRVLVVPVTDGEHKVVGLILRHDFFRMAAERMLSRPEPG